MAASAGLENQIFFWDLNALSNLTVANNTITSETECCMDQLYVPIKLLSIIMFLILASSFSGNTSSVYSLAMDRGGHFLASGSSDKVLHSLFRVVICTFVILFGYKC